MDFSIIDSLEITVLTRMNKAANTMSTTAYQ
jgi:hypothetical protein